MRLTQSEFNTIFLALDIMESKSEHGKSRVVTRRVFQARRKLEQMQAEQSLKIRMAKSNQEVGK